MTFVEALADILERYGNGEFPLVNIPKILRMTADFIEAQDK